MIDTTGPQGSNGPTLSPDVDAQTAHFHDARCGFSMVIPGGARLVANGSADAFEPTYEVLIQMSALGIALRYRLSHLQAPRNAGAVIPALVYAFAQNRCQTPPPAASATADQRRKWNVEWAASALYSLTSPDPHGADVEEVVMLYRSEHLITLTKRFRAAQVSPLVWTQWNRASMSSIRFGIADAFSHLAE